MGEDFIPSYFYVTIQQQKTRKHKLDRKKKERIRQSIQGDT